MSELHETTDSLQGKNGKKERRKTTLMVVGTIVLVIIAWLTYKRMAGRSSSAAQNIVANDGSGTMNPVDSGFIGGSGGGSSTPSSTTGVPSDTTAGAVAGGTAAIVAAITGQRKSEGRYLHALNNRLHHLNQQVATLRHRETRQQAQIASLKHELHPQHPDRHRQPHGPKEGATKTKGTPRPVHPNQQHHATSPTVRHTANGPAFTFPHTPVQKAGGK